MIGPDEVTPVITGSERAIDETAWVLTSLLGDRRLALRFATRCALDILCDGLDPHEAFCRRLARHDYDAELWAERCELAWLEHAGDSEERALIRELRRSIPAPGYLMRGGVA